jgi:hypothetical protein
MKMDNFFQIMDFVYRLNKKHPEIRFGQLIDTMVTKEESLFYLSDEELVKRLKTVLEEEEV